MGNGECQNCSERIQKFPLFFVENWPKEKVRQKLSQHTAELIGAPLSSAKNVTSSKPTVIAGLKNIAFFLKEIRKLNFSGNESPKKFRRPKI